MESIIEPVALELTNGRTVHILLTAGAAIRAKRLYGLDIERPVLKPVDDHDPASYETVLRILAVSCVQWSEEKQRWVHDPSLTAETIDDLADLVELPGASIAFETSRARSNIGLPRMPPPQTIATVASTSPASETILKPNGSASGLGLATQE